MEVVFRNVYRTPDLVYLVDLNVPLLLLLQALDPLIVVNALAGSNFLEHILDSRHHTLKTAEVDVGSVLQLGEDLIGVFLNLVLDVHLSSLLVGLFTRKGVVDSKVLRESTLGLLEFVVVKEGIAVSNSQEQPSFSLVGLGGRGVLVEKTTDESTVRGDTSSGGNHDVVGGRVLLRHEHNLSGRSGHLNFIARLGVTEEVGADTLLGWVLSLELRAPVGGTTDAQRSSLTSHVVSVSRRGDGVKTNVVGLSVLLGARRNDTPGLSLPVREVTLVVNDDVASLTSSLWSNNTLGGDNLSSERSLVLVNIDRDVGLVIVRLGFQEILGLRSTHGLHSNESSSKSSSTGDDLLSGIGGFDNFDGLLGSVGGRRGTSGGKGERSGNSGNLSESLCVQTYIGYKRVDNDESSILGVFLSLFNESLSAIFFYSPSRRPFSWSRWPCRERHRHCKEQ